MAGWHHRLNGHENEGQGSLECCSSWGHRVRLNLGTEQQQDDGYHTVSMSHHHDMQAQLRDQVTGMKVMD